MYFLQGESVPAQLVLVYPAFFRINRQRHNSIETMANADLVADPMQPPVIKVTFHRPAAPALLLDDPSLIPVRVLLLRLIYGEPTLSHEAQELLLLPIAIRNKLQQLLYRHPPTEPICRHRIVPAQLRPRSNHPETLQNPLYLRFLDGGGIPVPYLPCQ